MQTGSDDGSARKPNGRSSWDRTKFIVAWVLQFLLAALFAIQGIVKLGGSPAWVSRFRGWGYPDHFYFAVGLAELFGAILLLIPKLANFGAMLLMVVMGGAAATHVLHRERQVVTTVILFVLLGGVLLMSSRKTDGAPSP